MTSFITAIQQTRLPSYHTLNTSNNCCTHVQVLFLLCISGVALAQAGAAWSEIFPTHVFVIALMVTAEVPHLLYSDMHDTSL